MGSEERRVEEGGRVIRTFVAQPVLLTMKVSPLTMSAYFVDCMAMSGTPRPQRLHKWHIKNELGKATGANPLVATSMHGFKFLEKEGHCLILVSRALKVVREAAPGGDTP